MREINSNKNKRKLFTIGPVQMYPSTEIVRANGFPHFRTSEYGELVKINLKRLATLIGTKFDDNLIYMSSSGTAAMEATIENCFINKDKVLVINGGSFGHRFCELLKWHNVSYDSVDINWNEALTQKHLEPFEGKKYTALLVNLHETYTGQLYDINLLSTFCKRNNMYLIVDAISTIFADKYEMDKHEIDVTIFSSQKGLCLSPGMSIVAFSPRMIERINSNPRSSTYYFDFKEYLINIPRGQTPFTPPVCVMFELEDMLNLIESEGGIDARLKNIAQKCKYFRQRAKELGFISVKYPLSNMFTPLVFDDISAFDVIQTLQKEFNIYVNPSGGVLANTLLRVSHIGNTTISDIDILLDKLQKSVEIVRGTKL